MSLIWTQNMSVRIEQFDDDHKKLIRYVNELQSQIQDAKATGTIDPVEIEVIFHRMENYAKFHFSSEEKAMEKTGFPGLEEHRADHRNFIATVAKMSERFLGSNDLKHADEIMQFLHAWITDHVYRVDGKYVDHLHKHEYD
ncbi:MAG: bacteriohemerythrin [Terracidiphilus sp.]|jgi:hemerythrin